jgi:transcription initiation factor IIF auxiliary subunit
MGLEIEQDFQYQGEDWWRWWVWLEGSDEDLDAVQEVTYILHPTFPNPVRTIRSREDKFRLETSGWGTFTIYAKVLHKDGEVSDLQHDLILRYGDGTPTVA